jgi:hypothetical protein
MSTITYPTPSVSGRLEKQLQETNKLHEVNYGMLISAALLALALIALSWCISHSDRTTGQEPNPTSGLARHAGGMNIVTNQQIRPGQENYVHGDMPVLPVLTSND